MAVYSMTGYASAQQSASAGGGETDGRTRRLGLEIRSVNSRFLDLSFRLPDELRAQEPVLRSLLTARLKRGKVEVRASIENEDTTALPDPAPRLLQRLNSAQDAVRAWLPDAAPLSVADALRLCANAGSAQDDWSDAVPALAEKALKDLVQAREREGKRLSAMLQDRLEQLRALAHQATPLVPKLVEQQRQRFMERWKEAMALADNATLPEAAQDRALTEATAFAIRIDVAEEITRLDSHLDEIERLLKKGGEVGKRLDFLIQELHREANTLGSKSAAMELTRISVDMKVLIEQMREQVQNIE
ncbi:YicC family protein [Acidovorax sp. SUPP3434]|nr:YicC family protein [Acidovorax sp. SUPP2825]GKT02187.1 YicC family protein [Acidovorax sp. SUPP3434]